MCIICIIYYLLKYYNCIPPSPLFQISRSWSVMGYECTISNIVYWLVYRLFYDRNRIIRYTTMQRHDRMYPIRSRLNELLSICTFAILSLKEWPYFISISNNHTFQAPYFIYEDNNCQVSSIKKTKW